MRKELVGAKPVPEKVMRAHCGGRKRIRLLDCDSCPPMDTRMKASPLGGMKG